MQGHGKYSGAMLGQGAAATLWRQVPDAFLTRSRQTAETKQGNLGSVLSDSSQVATGLARISQVAPLPENIWRAEHTNISRTLHAPWAFVPREMLRQLKIFGAGASVASTLARSLAVLLRVARVSEKDVLANVQAALDTARVVSLCQASMD